jgi:GT2 family glycosyltransferase
VLFLNSDAIAREGAVARLVDFLESHEGCVLAGGCLVDAGTDRAQVGFTIRGYPTLANQIALMVGLERYWPRNPISRRQLMLDFDFNCTQLIDAQPAGACLVCRRSAFEAEGGFDEAFHYWFEDVDMVRRLAWRGRVVYVHDAVFDHVGGSTFEQWERSEIVKTRYASLIRYFEKHHSPGAVFCLRGVIALLAALRAVFFLGIDRRQATAYRAVLKLALLRRHEMGRGSP